MFHPFQQCTKHDRQEALKIAGQSESWHVDASIPRRMNEASALPRLTLQSLVPARLQRSEPLTVTGMAIGISNFLGAPTSSSQSVASSKQVNPFESRNRILWKLE